MPSVRSCSTEGVYFVVIEGVPQHCQWQELKDYLRDSVKVTPRKAQVLQVNEDGTRVGSCVLRNEAEAERAFDYLVTEGWRGHDIRVSMGWKHNINSQDPQDIERKRGPEQSRRRRTSNMTPVLASFPSNLPTSVRFGIPASITYNTSATSEAINSFDYVTKDTMLMPALRIAHMQTNKNRDGALTRALQETATEQRRAQTGLAIAQNLSDAFLQEVPPPHSALLPNQEYFAATGQQSIHISRLPYDTKSADLRTLLSRYGEVLDVSIKRGKEKRCSATAKYRRSSEAMLAIRQLNGKQLRNFTLVVRQDRSEASSVSSAPSTFSRGSNSDSPTRRLGSGQEQARAGPLVVNGARGPGYYKKREDEDDSESLADDSSADGRIQDVPRKSFSHQARR